MKTDVLTTAERGSHDGRASVAHALGSGAALCVAGAWLVPNHYPPWLAFHNDGAMVVALLLFAAAALVSKRFERLPVVAWVVVLVATLPWLQFAFGLLTFSGDAWVSCLYLLCLGTAIAVGFGGVRSKSQELPSLLAAAMLAAALVSSLIAMTQCLETAHWGIWAAETPPGSRGIGNLAQPNNLGTLIAFGALGLLLVYEQRRITPLVACALLLPLLIGAATTQSRTTLLFCPAVLLIRYAALKRGVAWRTGAASLVAVIAVQLSLMWSWPLLADALLILPPETLTSRGAQSGRFAVWPVLFDAVTLSPWTGYGWLQTSAAQLAAADRHPQYEELFMQAHNLFLDLLVWCGWPLGVLLSGAIVAWYVSRALTLRSIEAAVGMMVVSVLGVHAMLELPYHYAYFLIPAGLWIGIVESSRGSLGLGSARAPVALAAATAALSLAVVWNYPAVEEDFRLVRFEAASIGTLRASRPAPNAPFLSSLTAYLRFARQPVVSGMSEADLAAMEAVVKHYPFSPALFRYGKALALNGRLEAALKVFVKMRHIHGELRYQQWRTLLHQQVIEGTHKLQALDAALPR